MLQQRWTWRQWYTRCLVCRFSSDSGTTALFFSPNHFPRCRVLKMADLIFVNEMLSWLIEWLHWPVKWWHAVLRHHILVPVQLPATITYWKTLASRSEWVLMEKGLLSVEAVLHLLKVLDILPFSSTIYNGQLESMLDSGPSWLVITFQK